MKKTAIMLALFALSFAAIGVADAAARHHGRGAKGHGDALMGFGMVRMLDKLDLAQDQQTKVASLLKSNRGEIEQTMKDMVQARSKLWDAMNAKELSEANVKEAARYVADQQEKMILLRARVLSSMRDILTPEQNARLMSVAGKGRCRMDGFVDRKLSALDKWIAEHGEQTR